MGLGHEMDIFVQAPYKIKPLLFACMYILMVFKMFEELTVAIFNCFNIKTT